MSFQINAIDKHNNSISVNVDKRNTDICPICHRHINPIQLSAYLNGTSISSPALQLINRCPNEDCGLVFFSYYNGVLQTGNKRWYFYERDEPTFPVEPEVPQNVSSISPKFALIFSQAFFAEQMNLKEICGMAYRKALEFLVKDYLSTKLEKLKIDEAAIQKTPLAKCIQNYIDDPMTKRVALRAAWLGNDETHYYRIWEEKDLEDLKTLLRLTINSIENQLLAEKYEDEMRD